MPIAKSGSRWLVMALALLLVLILAGVVQAQGEGALQGQVVNGTASGPPIGSGVPVRLDIFRGQTKTGSLETVTDADGRFSFKGLDPDPDLAYELEATYLDVPYASAEPYHFAEGQTLVEASLSVYETTDDASGLTLDSVHIIAESFEQVLRISEIHLYGNSLDRTYVGAEGGDPRATLHIPVPQEAVGLAFGEGMSAERFVQQDGLLLDTAPVLPGSETSLAFFSYHLLVNGHAVPLERQFAYPVAMLNLLAAQPGLTLTSEQLQDLGPQNFQGRQYEYYAAQDLGPDKPLLAELVLSPIVGGQTAGGMPGAEHPAVAEGNQGLLRWLGLALVALVLLGAVIYPLASRGTASVAAPARDLAADAQARPLLARLADLEGAWEAGQVDESSYERQRAELYAELEAL